MMQRRVFVQGGAAALGLGLNLPLRAQAPALRFGQSASLTGGQAAYGKDVRDGIQAAFNGANRSDGKGPRVELVTLDDGGEKERCKANAAKLVEGGATALIGLTSGAGAEACLPLVEGQRVVLLGTASGNMGIRSDKLAMAYHVRPGYDLEYSRLVGYVKTFGMRRVALVHLKDTSPANQLAMTAALAQAQIQLTTTLALDRNQPRFDAEVKQLLADKLDCVLFSTNAQPISAIVAGMAAAGYIGFYFASSFAGQTLIDDMADKGHSVIMSQVVPRPNAVATGVVKQYREDLAALGNGARPGFTSLEGYIVGRVALEAARTGSRGGATVSRARFRDALAELNVDLGGYRLHFTPPSPLGSRFVEVVAINRNGRVIG
jgi:branched-chain amino acid transport system substrate-binding protein